MRGGTGGRVCQAIDPGEDVGGEMRGKLGDRRIASQANNAAEERPLH